MVVNLRGICCAHVVHMLCICCAYVAAPAVHVLIPNTIFFEKSQRIQQASSVVGHFSVFVAAIVIKITNDLPAAQGTSSRVRHQSKDDRNAFRVPLYEFTLLIAFLFLGMWLLWNYWDHWEKHAIKRVSYRVGKCDKVNLSLIEILGVFDPQLRGNCFNFCKVGGNIFIHFCCCYCWTRSQKGRPGVLPEAWRQFGILCHLQKYVQWCNYHRNVVALIFGCEKKDKQNNETVYQILNGHQIKPNFSFISTGAILNPYLNSHVKFFSILYLIIIQDVTY